MDERRGPTPANDADEELLPKHIRPLAFAGTELALDIVHLARAIYGVDMESALILMCVADATMRPQFLALGEDGMSRAVNLPNEERGSISRLMVADKIGLPRETVRRKIKELTASGHITVDDKDRVQIKVLLGHPHVQRELEQGHRAVLRYRERLRALGVDPDEGF
ncbi:MAG: hypothetical protein AB7O98_02255 [Hyphomonadaceae bacterium]